MTRGATASVTDIAESLDPARLLEAIRSAGITDVVTVPDTHQQSLLQLLAGSTEPRLITVCTEDEAMGVNLGLYLGGRTPMLLIQNSGLYACLNTLRGLALDARVPACLLIGEFFRNPAIPSRENPGRLVRMLEPTLELWDVPFHRLEHDDDIRAVPGAVEQAHRERRPVALLVGATTAEVAG
ncbi:thiamine pyrophosphate-binding protein [Pseudonocardia dioxanivorans]|uniref:thiamine pyrophosphate-binding protein n=1 Tax=Pseudonocardia dioxanivorans TaxID=240495 RepID=UPI000CD106DD|nr:thiamine pyrophosphate-binding protein [Pseudonocardia dioxanivorans]